MANTGEGVANMGVGVFSCRGLNGELETFDIRESKIHEKCEVFY